MSVSNELTQLRATSTLYVLIILLLIAFCYECRSLYAAQTHKEVQYSKIVRHFDKKIYITYELLEHIINIKANR